MDSRNIEVKTNLTLSDAEIRAVMDYIWQHCRAYPTSKAFQVWEKMYAQVTGINRHLTEAQTNCLDEDVQVRLFG